MGGEYGTYGGEEKCVDDFGWEKLKERDQLINLGLDGRLILYYILK
jgi:hypothetical protein